MGNVRAKKANQMDEATLRAVLSQARSTADTHDRSGVVSAQRVKALKYYHGEPRGDERKGRSKVISRDVLDTVETLMPELVEVFVGGDDAVEFEPVGKDDEKMAEQATEYCNYVFLRDNNGFDILYTATKDALREKNGIVKVCWEDTQKKKKFTFNGLDGFALALLGEDEDVEIESQRAYRNTIGESGYPEEQEVGKNEEGDDILYDVEVCHYYDSGRVAIYNIPNEEFFISPQSTGLEPRPEYCGHEKESTASELIEKYPDYKHEISLLGGYSTLEWSPEKIVRHQDTSMVPDSEVDTSTRKIAEREYFIFLDFDGDGIAEYRRIVTLGNTDLVVENDEVDDHPFADLCVIREPHRFHATAPAELVTDIQDVKTVALRQYLDNIYAANNQRTIVVQGMADIKTVMDNRPNGIILTKSANAVQPYPMVAMGGESLNLMNKMDEIRESRTGVFRSSRGLDVDRLHDTAQGIDKLMDKQDKRIMLMARVLAEGVRRVFKLILRNSIQYQDKPRTIRLREEWVQMDPRTWNADMDVKVKVGLGTGNRQETITRAMQTLQVQRETAQLLPGMVTPEKAYKGVTDFMKATGNKTPENYFVDPASPEYKPPQPQPDPEIMKAQMQIAADKEKAMGQIQADQAKSAAQIQADIQKAQVDAELKRYEIAERMKLEREKIIAEMQIAREQMAYEASMKVQLAAKNPGGSVAT